MTMSNEVGLNRKTSLALDSRIPWDHLDNKVILVTGATGLVGKAVVTTLLERNDSSGSSIRVILPVRDLDRLPKEYETRSDVTACVWDASDVNKSIRQPCNYIVHCAAPTSSRYFVEHPVETIQAILNGTLSMLETARYSNARMVFVSSMEVYGELSSNNPITEDCGGPIDSMIVRSSYPQAKQLAETLCASYAAEYSTEVCVARLAQTFGFGVPSSDGRVFSQFAKSSLQGADIVLHTAGTKRNTYVAIDDAVAALLLLAARGVPGTAYNVANEATYCSIREMAEMVVNKFGNGSTKVVIEEDSAAAALYPKPTQQLLDTSRICDLGWRPTMGLEEMYEELLRGWQVCIL